jgi:Holliday junction DNA helicase RuvA
MSSGGMIGWLRGEIRYRDSAAGDVILDVGGVGYEVATSLQTLAFVGEVGETCELWIHTHVREDVLALFGFASMAERALFRLLMSVPKVGPKQAMTTMSGLPAQELARCLAQGDVERLTRIPGIGRKTAEQMTLTLRDKIAPHLADLGASDTPIIVTESDERSNEVRHDAFAMLVALGWKPKQVEQVLGALLNGEDVESNADELALDSLVRLALTRLMER